MLDIKTRYKAKCLGKNEGRYWLSKILEEWELYGPEKQAVLPKDKIVDREIRAAATNPLAEANFLKTAFLEAMKPQLTGRGE